MFASCVFHLLFAILTLVRAAGEPEPLICQECDSVSSCVATCTVTKNVGNCTVAVEEISLGGENETFVHKGCLTHSGMPVFISVTLGKGQFLRSNLSLCNEDKCNNGNPSIPANITLNGLECPSCFNSMDNDCTADTMPCTGIETYCIVAYGLQKTDDPNNDTLIVAKGCATESVQVVHLPLNISLQKERYVVMKMNTYKAPPVSLPTTAFTTVTAPTTSPNGTPTPKSISFVLLLTSLSWMLLVKVVS